ncbi:MAG: hypothetical protein WAW36_19420, partial [Methylovulum miyakonense]|uniref:hypothetical protein n=1 Tax=Methylovulum miyakonense TaxID=645578 RepID=UPI003BB5A15D
VGYAVRTFCIDFMMIFKGTHSVPYLKSRKLDRSQYILTPCLLELWVLGEGSILSKFASGWVNLWALRLES